MIETFDRFQKMRIEAAEFKVSGLAGGIAAGIFAKTTEISPAQLVDLGNNAVELVPSAGENQIIEVHRVNALVLLGTGLPDLGGGDGDVVIGYENDELLTIGGLLDQSEDWFQTAVDESFGVAVDNVIGSALKISSPDTLTGRGAVAAISVANAGADYLAGEIGAIVGGNPNAIFVIDAVDGGGAVTAVHVGYGGGSYLPDTGVLTSTGVITPDIVAVDQDANTFSILGDYSNLFASPITEFAVESSTGNDGTYTIAGAVYAAPNTVITVVESIPDSTVDGNLNVGNVPGGGIGSGFTLDIDEVLLDESGGSLSVTVYYSIIEV